MTETDAGAFDDPFVTGIDALRKLVVRHARARQRRAGALQDRAARHAALSRRKLARSSVTWRVISFSISSAHRRSEEHTSELQSLMRISYAVFCLKKKTNNTTKQTLRNKIA